jgi:hypothetical protein
MKNSLFVILSTIVLGLLFIIAIPGCSEEDVLLPEDFAPPSNPKALSRDGGVSVYWTASPSVGSSSFLGYRIVVTHIGTQSTVDSTQVGKTITNYTASNLVNGQSYKFAIRSVKDNGDVSQAIEITWGPTQRFTPARIYEYDSQNPSGLQFSTGSTFAFRSSNPDNRSVIDFWIDGQGNTTPLLKSPNDQSISTGWRTTLFVETAATGMDQQVDLPLIGSFRSTPGLTITPNKVYFAKTQDNNYVRFTVSAVQGTAPNRYVDITLAYNSGSGVWAKR